MACRQWLLLVIDDTRCQIAAETAMLLLFVLTNPSSRREAQSGNTQMTMMIRHLRSQELASIQIMRRSG